MLKTCHLANIAIRLGRELNWDPNERKVIGDAEANTFWVERAQRLRD